MSRKYDFVTLVMLTFSSSIAQAGIFDLPAFLDQGRFSIGSEADIALTNGTGAAVNLKPRYGLSDFFNIQGIIGTGAGDRRFRLGTTLDVEYFPDVGNQPGLASPVTILYTRIKGDSDVSLFVAPLVYKTFHGKEGVAFTPFVSLPVGWYARDNNLRGFTQIAFGTLFAPTNLTKWKFTAEAGFSLNHSYSYIAGGVTFFPWGYAWDRNKGATTEQPVEGGAALPAGALPAIERSPQSIRPLR